VTARSVRVGRPRMMLRIWLLPYRMLLMTVKNYVRGGPGD